MVKVRTKNNTITKFKEEKITKTLIESTENIEIKDKEKYVDIILKEFKNKIFDNINTKQIEEILILCVSSFIEKDYVYDIIAKNLLLKKIYKEFLQADFKKSLYKDVFKKNILIGIKEKILTTNFLSFNIDWLFDNIKLERDNLLNYMGVYTLYDRYLIKHKGIVLEIPQTFWLRIAIGLSINESINNRNKITIEFYNVMSELKYIPSTPTLFHSGFVKPQLSSCFVSTVPDDLKGIFKCMSDNAQISKWSGGIGNDWSSVRSSNSEIKSTRITSQGVIPFLKIVNDITLAINRSGKRRGAICVYLETWHLDIESFLDLKRNTGDERRRTHDIHTANWIPDLFMKRVKNNEEWTLFCPSETSDLHELYGLEFEKKYKEYEKMVIEGKIKLYKKINAKSLWRKILTRLFENGSGWITFKDPCNIRNPQDHSGIIHNSNLCTEITLNNNMEETAVCNLGSLNLIAHEKNLKIDKTLLSTTIKTAIRMLDNVIDINYYPTPEAKQSNLKHRPIGLGLMGLQDLFFKIKIPFESKEALEFMDRTMEYISYHAILSSSKLAKERGYYNSFKGSKWDRDILPIDTISLLEKERNSKIEINKNSYMNWEFVRELIKINGLRNSNLMAIAPTATISNIAGCFPCTEPIFRNIYVKANNSGEFTIVNKYLIETLKNISLWDDNMLEKIKYYNGDLSFIENIPDEIKLLYKESFKINQEHLIKMNAIRGKWIDQSQSHNIFIQGESGKKLSDIYFKAWELGLKTTYYLRTIGASNIEKSTIEKSIIEKNDQCQKTENNCISCE